MRAWEFMREDYNVMDRSLASGPPLSFGASRPAPEEKEPTREINHEMIDAMVARAKAAERGEIEVVSMAGWSREQIKDFFRG